MKRMLSTAPLSTTERAALEAYVYRLRDELGSAIVELRLFGSKARGESSPESDIDVLVVMEEVTPQLKNHVVDLAFDINLEHRVLISPVVFSREQREHHLWRVTHFGRATMREGIPL